MIVDICRAGIMREGLLDLISELPSSLVMAEIGSWQGESTEMFLKSGKVKKLYSIDPYGPDERRMEAEDIFKWRVKGFDVVKLRMRNPEGMLQVPQVDFVYIDGDHRYEWVKLDIQCSLPHIRPGGIIAGHDYCFQYRDMVVKAVHEILGEPDKIYNDTSWLKYL